MTAAAYDLVKQAAATLARGDARAALSLLARAETISPALPEIHLHRAFAHRTLNDPSAAIAALDEVLQRDPDHLVALLSKGALLERSSGPKHAARVYRIALRLLPDDDTRLPPALYDPVRAARDCVAQDTAAMHAFLRRSTDALRRDYHDERLDRFDESLDVFAGAARPYPQRPLLLHYTRLAAIPFHDRALFPFLPELEAETETMAAELRAVLDAHEADFHPYIQYPKGTPVRQWGELNHSRRWSSYFLWRDGVRHDEACERCPFTSALADRLPLMRQPGFAPTVVFSALEPHTRIPPHTGSTNTRLLCHLPLILPGPARFRVGSQTRPWRLGEAWVFDDTIEHEAWNDADAMRVILILDLWNPSLTVAEQTLVAAMMDARRAYYADQR